ncbi:MAG: aminopeptidase [Spirochaetia bacterium]
MTATDPQILSTSQIILRDVLAVRPGETALIITNLDGDVYEIALALYRALLEAKVMTSLIIQPEKTSMDFCEDAVAMAIRSNPDILISLSTNKMGKDLQALKSPYIVNKKSIDSHFQYLLATKKSRGFWSPGITCQMFTQAVPIDYVKMSTLCDEIKTQLDHAIFMHIQTPAGTDLYVDISERTAFVDDGNFSRPGEAGNLPAGEAFISPTLYKAYGKIVFDGSLALKDKTLIPTTPVTLEVKDGLVSHIQGGNEAQALIKTIEHGEKLAIQLEKEGKLKPGDGTLYAKNARHLGEIGIGVNPAAKVIGNMLIDEKALNTCHIAIGSNYDDDGPSLIHQDCVCLNPTITLTYPDRTTRPLTIS